MEITNLLIGWVIGWISGITVLYLDLRFRAKKLHLTKEFLKISGHKK